MSKVNQIDINKININELLQVHEYENTIYIPHEIFNDFEKGMSNLKHFSFAYSYYFLISWLYRYAKYGNINIDAKMIKKILGVYEKSKTYDYLIKKDGLLDELGYTLSSTDFPYAWNFNGGDIVFDMISELDVDMRKLLLNQRGRNYRVKIPLKGIHRTKESMMDNDEDGTFYYIGATHGMDMDFFIKCMENDNLGVYTFCLYGYLKWKCSLHGGKYNSSKERIGQYLGMSESTVHRRLTWLLKLGKIAYEESESVKIDGRYKKEANTYWIR